MRTLPEEEKDNVELPPKKIDILGKKFTIKLLQPDEQENCDGYMNLSEQIIAIRLQPANDYNHDTGFHEMVHAVDEILSIGLKEKQVHQLSAGLIAVLKQNPDFIAWLLK
jgi:hypothetical protein